jgi:hypothetical protein
VRLFARPRAPGSQGTTKPKRVARNSQKRRMTMMRAKLRTRYARRRARSDGYERTVYQKSARGVHSALRRAAMVLKMRRMKE